MKDITFNGKKITVLRQFNNNQFLVVQGNNWYKGLYENYQEFSSYTEALVYFNLIKQ